MCFYLDLVSFISPSPPLLWWKALGWQLWIRSCDRTRPVICGMHFILPLSFHFLFHFIFIFSGMFLIILFLLLLSKMAKDAKKHWSAVFFSRSEWSPAQYPASNPTHLSSPSSTRPCFLPLHCLHTLKALNIITTCLEMEEVDEMVPE